MDNPTSSAWAKLMDSYSLSIDHLKNKYGVTWVHPTRQNEMRLGIGAHVLVIKRNRKQISALIEDPAMPPRRRIFSVEGDAGNPLLFEKDGSAKPVGEVFEDLTAWLRNVAAGE